MENELEVVNIRLVKEPSLYSVQTLDSPQAVVELMSKELSLSPIHIFLIRSITDLFDSILDMITMLFRNRWDTLLPCTVSSCLLYTSAVRERQYGIMPVYTPLFEKEGA